MTDVRLCSRIHLEGGGVACAEVFSSVLVKLPVWVHYRWTWVDLVKEIVK